MPTAVMTESSEKTISSTAICKSTPPNDAEARAFASSSPARAASSFDRLVVVLALQVTFAAVVLPGNATRVEPAHFLVVLEGAVPLLDRKVCPTATGHRPLVGWVLVEDGGEVV